MFSILNSHMFSILKDYQCSENNLSSILINEDYEHCKEVIADELPLGWTKCKSNNIIFYVNHNDKTVTSIKPPRYSNLGSTDGLPYPWVKRTTNTGKTYYINTKESITTWTHP